MERRAEFTLSKLLSTLPTQFQPENIAADQTLLEAFVKGINATAFVCVEYNLALELVAILEQLGQRVPEDVSVVRISRTFTKTKRRWGVWRWVRFWRSCAVRPVSTTATSIFT